MPPLVFPPCLHPVLAILMRDRMNIESFGNMRVSTLSLKLVLIPHLGATGVPTVWSDNMTKYLTIWCHPAQGVRGFGEWRGGPLTYPSLTSGVANAGRHVITAAGLLIDVGIM